MASPFANQPKIKIAQAGGLKHLQRLLGLLQDGHRFCSLDAVIVSLDLEASSDERAKLGQSTRAKPLLKEYGIATVDTRHVRLGGSASGSSMSIVTRHWATSLVKTKRRCVFSDTVMAKQEELPSIVKDSLRIKNTATGGPGEKECHRNIVIVGHSVKRDLRLLQRLGIDVYTVAPLLTILDTHNMARAVLERTVHTRSDCGTVRKFTLGAVLGELRCPHERAGLHNAGNDATYTMCVLFKLAIRWCQARDLGEDEREILGRLSQHALRVG